MFLSNSSLSVNSKLICFKRLDRDLWSHQMSYFRGVTHRVISDRLHRLLVTLSYFRPDRFVQILSQIPILILRLYLLVSGCLTSLC